MAQSENELASVIERLMSDGEAQRLVEKLKSSYESQNASGADDVSGDAADVASEIPLGNSASGAQLVEKLPEVISALSPLIKNESASHDKIHGNSAVSHRNDLLRALKPYLSDGRRQLIDKIMQLSKVGELVDMLPHDR